MFLSSRFKNHYLVQMHWKTTDWFYPFYHLQVEQWFDGNLNKKYEKSRDVCVICYPWNSEISSLLNLNSQPTPWETSFFCFLFLLKSWKGRKWIGHVSETTAMVYTWIHKYCTNNSTEHSQKRFIDNIMATFLKKRSPSLTLLLDSPPLWLTAWKNVWILNLYWLKRIAINNITSYWRRDCLLIKKKLNFSGSSKFEQSWWKQKL